MRGEGAPSPIYEGEDSVMAWLLSGRTQAEKYGRDTVTDTDYYQVRERMQYYYHWVAAASLVITSIIHSSSPPQVPLPSPGEAKRAIMYSFTKEHSAEYQSQALIDLAFRMRDKIDDLQAIKRIVIHTSHHTHSVIGSGANDPQKLDPFASRETLDHSIMYIFAVALEVSKKRAPQEG